jgi:hypothetical protein
VVAFESWKFPSEQGWLMAPRSCLPPAGGGDLLLVGLVASEKRGFEAPEEARPIISANRSPLQQRCGEVIANRPGSLGRLELAALFQMERRDGAPVGMSKLAQRLAFLT